MEAVGPLPARFLLVRHQDVSGVSGTGVVAHGVRWADGTATLRWRTKFKSTALYESMEELVFIHAHDGASGIVWLDRNQNQDPDRLLEIQRAVESLTPPN